MANADLFRLFVLVLAIFGVINVLRWIRQSVDNRISIGPVTMSKVAWTRAVMLWNGIGIPLLAIYLFAVWRP
jgi:hypothetical protein